MTRVVDHKRPVPADPGSSLRFVRDRGNGDDQSNHILAGTEVLDVYAEGPSPADAKSSNLNAFSCSSTGPSKLGGVAIVPMIQP